VFYKDVISSHDHIMIYLAFFSNLKYYFKDSNIGYFPQQSILYQELQYFFTVTKQ